MSQSFSSRWLRRIIVSAVAGCVLSGPALAQEKAKLRVSVIPIVDVAPLYAAQKQGYFAEEGLEVDTAPVSGGAAGIPGLVGGAYDFAFSNIVSLAQAVAQDLDVKIVAPGSDVRTEAPDIAGIFALADAGIKTGADLNGKTLAVNNRNNNIWLYAREWIEQTGGDVNKVTMREIPFPQMADAVRRKQVDAAMTVEPFFSTNVKDGTLVAVDFPYIKVQPGLNVAQYVATDDFIAKNPETVARFKRALKKGAEWVNANADQPAFAELIASYTKMQPELVQNLVLAPAPVSVSAESVQKTLDLMKKHGLLEAPMKASDLLYGDLND
ncbi:ABC transporter substrate-binding protein [Pusillimonas sp. CC-YST705]|uniref:ABC transporter substrate-binding protein n=1 Tax=Mesopusillimonas faecipullorum TaxID=2755040 RepID=A0ABS8CE81_9BURK|nr:ABC transporter substrate-binding protein [Mesopusillimonas faecipullorum]MCB5364328.1 ABC transporter substrate-binding protein [Mesopusillimonas faecipullorum]